MKTRLKSALLGKPGLRPRRIPAGLLRGLDFNIDIANQALRLVGLDERELTGAMRRLAGGVKCALDIGANNGWYSLFFAAQPNIEQVYAFEPLAECRDAVEANFRLNDPSLRQKLHLMGKMVGDVNNDNWCRLDDVLPNIPLPALFKIDVEGGELDVLKGARNLLTKAAQVLIVETHSLDLERHCLCFLKDLGYQTRIVKNGWYRLFFPEKRSIPHNRWLIAVKNVL